MIYFGGFFFGMSEYAGILFLEISINTYTYTLGIVNIVINCVRACQVGEYRSVQLSLLEDIVHVLMCKESIYIHKYVYKKYGYIQTGSI